VAYQPEPGHLGNLPAAHPKSGFSLLSREVFRAQTGSEIGKEARWLAETALLPMLAGKIVTRNELLNYPSATYGTPGRGRTDILHEYFVPPERLADFLDGCRRIIPAHRQDLLNVTLRYLDADRISVLRYAPSPRISLVMLFVQRTTGEAESDMAALTRELIDQALAVGGSYYLPYRSHATREQFAAAYDQLDAFIARKRHVDPELKLRNALWDRYMA